jgi:WD40 repeat protein/predicted Ser/Thr protein kinase
MPEESARNADMSPPRPVEFPPEDVTIAPRATDKEGATLSFEPEASYSTLPVATSFSHGNARYFGDYELLQELARGGMGVVYKAKQGKLNRTVAIKMILAGQFAGEEDVKRFYAEAEAAAHLDHPGIVPIFEVGEHDGQHFYSMGFIEGRSLAERVKDGPLPPREAAEVVRKVAEAMHYAHQHGVIHRDLKPANILIGRDGQSRVTDFGLAKRTEGDSNLTGTGQILGTPSYMPPEQAAGQTDRIGPRSDVYSLGAVLYCLLTGRPPFQAASPIDTVMQVLDRDPVAPRQLNSRVPRDLETICLKCLEKNVARRYASAKDLADELTRFLDGAPILARSVSRGERIWRLCQRYPLVTALAMGIVLAMATGTGVSVYFALHARYQEGEASKKAHAESIARAQAEDELRRAETARYAFQLALAHRDMRDGNFLRARIALDSAPAELRRWEHRYLSTLCDRIMQTFALEAASIHSLAYSPDGKLLASAGSGKATVLRDAATGHVVRELERHEDNRKIAFSPDGRRLASAGGHHMISQGNWNEPHHVKVWEVATGKTIFASPGALDVAFGPEGDSIAFISERTKVTIHSLAENRDVRTFDLGPEFVQGVAISPDGQMLATCGDSLKLWDMKTGKAIRDCRGHTSRVVSVRFSHDGKRIATSSDDQTVKIWDGVSGREIFSLEGHHSVVFDLAFSPDDAYLVSTSWDNALRVWDMERGQLVRTLRGHSNFVNAVAMHPQGARLASAGMDRTIRLWRWRDDIDPLTLHVSFDYAHSLALSPNSTRLATGGGGFGIKQSTGGMYRASPLQVWNLAAEREVLQREHHPGLPITAVAYSPDGQFLASASGGNDAQDQPLPANIDLMDAPTGDLTRRLTGHTMPITRLCFDKHSRRLASVSEDGTLRVWEAASGRAVAVFESRQGPGDRPAVRDVAFHPDGDRLVTAAADGAVHFWSVPERKLLATVQEASGATGVALDSTGKLLAVSCEDATINLYEFATRKRLRTLRGHSDCVWGVAFTPDDSRLASASFDRTVKLWDLVTAQEVLTLEGPARQAQQLAFSANGEFLACGAHDGKVRVWKAAPFETTGDYRRANEATRRVVHALLQDGAKVYVTDGAAKLELRRAAELEIRNFPVVAIDGNGQGEKVQGWIDRLAGLPRLEELILRDARLSAHELRQIDELPKLTSLNLDGADFQAEDFAKLQLPPNLQSLSIAGTRVGAESLGTLSKLANLQTLICYNTPFTLADAQQLKQSLPDCKVFLGPRAIPDAAISTAPDYAALATGSWTRLLPASEMLQKSSGVRTLGDIIDIERSGLQFPSVSAKNALLRAKAQRIYGANAALFLRGNVLHDHYGAYCNQNRSVGLGMNFHGSWNFLGSGKVTLHPEDPFEIAFSAVDDVLTVYINGKKIAQARDTTLRTEGFPKIEAYLARVLFTDVEFQNLDATLASE